MRLDLKDLLSAGDGQRDYRVSADLKEAWHCGQSYRVEEAPCFDIRVRNISSKSLEVRGHTVVTLIIPCDRCLREVSVAFPIDIDEAFGIEDEQIVPREDENEGLAASKYLDIDRMVYERIELGWPDKVLCREDCKGLCPVCGHDLNAGDCGCERRVLDPRMAQFLDVFVGEKSD